MRIKSLLLLLSLPLYADIHNVIIVGSGPAGLSAALCAARMQLAPLVVEGDDPGGNLIYAGTIENWPGEPSITGPDLINRMYNHAESQGAQFISGAVAQVDLTQSPYTLTLADGTVLTTWSIIIASGTEPQKIQCPGEEKYWGHGVAVCPICDGPLFKNKSIVIVGCGDEAITRALFMLQYTDDITMVCNAPVLNASASLSKKLMAQTEINVIYNAHVTEIVGDGTKVTGVRIDTQDDVLPAAGVFLALGEQGHIDWCAAQLAHDAKGYLLLFGPTVTSMPGVFAAGTVATTPTGRPYTLALSAAGSGCMAALAAWSYVCAVQGSKDSLPDDATKHLCPDCWSSICCQNMPLKQ